MNADFEQVQYSDVSSSSTTLGGIRSVVAYGELTGTGTTCSDAIAAFVQPDLPENDCYFAYLPDELLTPARRLLCKSMRRPVFRLHKPLYGLPIASRTWHHHVDHIMCDLLKFKMIEDWPMTYVREHKEHNQCAAWYVDDINLAGSDQAKVWEELRALVDLTDPVPIEKVLGVHFRMSVLDATTTAVDTEMTSYFKQSVEMYTACSDHMPLASSVHTPYIEPDPVLESQPGLMAPHASSLLMKLLYGARMCSFHLCYIISCLACQITKWSKNSDRMLWRLFSFINTYSAMSLRGILDRSELNDVEIIGYGDADLAGSRDTARSVSGCIAGIGAKKSWMALEWGAQRQSATATATTEAELVALSRLVKSHRIPLQQLWNKFLGRPIAVRLREDNQAAIKIVEAGFSTALRHMQKHHRVSIGFLHDAIQPGNHMTLEYVNTEDQFADVFTKPLARAAFEHVISQVGAIMPASYLKQNQVSSSPTVRLSG